MRCHACDERTDTRTVESRAVFSLSWIRKKSHKLDNWKDLKLKIAKSARAVISCSGLNSKVGFYVKNQDNKESIFKTLEFWIGYKKTLKSKVGFRGKYSNVESWSRDCIPLPLVKCFSCGRGYISNLRCGLQPFEESEIHKLQLHAYLPIQYKEYLLQKISTYLSSKTKCLC